MTELKIEPSGSKDFGSCDCCGGQSRTVWGYAHGPAGTVAAYFVQRTLGRVVVNPHLRNPYGDEKNERTLVFGGRVDGDNLRRRVFGPLCVQVERIGLGNDLALATSGEWTHSGPTKVFDKE